METKATKTDYEVGDLVRKVDLPHVIALASRIPAGTRGEVIKVLSNSSAIHVSWDLHVLPAGITAYEGRDTVLYPEEIEPFPLSCSPIDHLMRELLDPQ